MPQRLRMAIIQQDRALIAARSRVSIRVAAASPLPIMHPLLRIGLMGHVVRCIRIPMRWRVLRLSFGILVRKDLLGAALSCFDRACRDSGALARVVMPRLRHQSVISLVVSVLSLLRHGVALFPRHWRCCGHFQASGSRLHISSPRVLIATFTV